jgi:hypothetical protein
MARSNTARWERDHRAPQVAAREHGAAMRSAWTMTLSRWKHGGEGTAHRPARRSSLHLPPGLVARLPHPHLPHPHLPHPHLPHLHLPHLHLPRRSRTGPPAEAPSQAGAEEDPAGARP